MLLAHLAQAGFMRLPLLPQSILHSVADVIPQGMQIALQQVKGVTALSLCCHMVPMLAEVATDASPAHGSV